MEQVVQVVYVLLDGESGSVGELPGLVSLCGRAGVGRPAHTFNLGDGREVGH